MRNFLDFALAVIFIIILILFLFLYFLASGFQAEADLQYFAQYTQMALEYKDTNAILTSKIPYGKYYIITLDALVYMNKYPNTQISQNLLNIMENVLENYSNDGVYFGFYYNGNYYGYCQQDIITHNVSGEEIMICAPEISTMPIFIYVPLLPSSNNGNHNTQVKRIGK